MIPKQPIDGTPLRLDIDAIDLFCGAGGLSRGLLDAGIKVKLGIDVDPECKYPYEANNEAAFLCESVEKVDGRKLTAHYRPESIKLLAGCAPCQTFSTYNQKASDKDKRWWLLAEFSRLVEEIAPDIVTMENVPGLKQQQVFREFVDTLERRGYEVWTQVVNCAEYGVPQQRHRLVLLASRKGQIRLMTPEEFGADLYTVFDVINDLPPLNAGDSDPNDPLHRCSKLSPINLQRIRASKEGGSWRDWPRALIAECHKKSTGKTYAGVYGRMSWLAPSPTMTTQFYGFGNGRFGHPEQDRAISLREGAILQSFPRDYQFVPPGQPISQSTIGRLIGNAVPVKLGEVIGKSIRLHVDQMMTD